MLIVGPNSTCDICMESYMEVAGMPHVIPCGHIFCRGCLTRMQRASLQNLLRSKCPICRQQFSSRDIHQLRVDSGGSSPTRVTPQVDTQVQRLLDDIEKMVDGHATVEEMQRAVDQCNAYHDLHPGSSLRIPLGVSRRLVTSYMEAHRKLFELASARDDIRDRLILHLEFAQTQYRTLDQVRRSEKETVLKNEEDSRTRYDEMNNRWRSSVESMTQKCQSLCEELDQLRQTNQTATHGNASNVVQSNRATTSYVVLSFALQDHHIDLIPSRRRSAVVRNSSGRVVHRSYVVFLNIFR
ncbi:hypothetical protein JVT61DRAFT_14668 [Boletus reticuloceps]|uniref:RING-type domain-containing protein n=1 Tax=Boletus reticuloceps TaxID=495285 RepID=A0A8I2YV08_9AGAM|nr:hypothetical protein JVT61DRAFT_14668 [Boletus reticuloceps]